MVVFKPYNSHSEPKSQELSFAEHAQRLAASAVREMERQHPLLSMRLKERLEKEIPSLQGYRKDAMFLTIACSANHSLDVL